MRRPRSIYSVPVYLPWQPSAMFAEELEGGGGGFGAFFSRGPERSLHTSSLHWSECVCEREGEAWVPGNPSHRTHTRPTL